jgi:hypothetical protein
LRRASNALPSGDIYVLNSSGLEGGELLLAGGISWSFSQNLHLAGRTNGSNDEAVLRTPPATVTFNGGVYLDEDASLSSYDPNGLATFDFRGGLFGPGALALPNGATVNLYSPATISGINGFGNVTLNVSTNGTLGTGRVWLRGGRDHRVVFTGQSGLVVDNEFRCDAGSLDLSFSFAKVALTRSGFFSSANLSTFSSLTLGADIDFGRINAVCSQDDAAGADRIVADIGGFAPVAPLRLRYAKANTFAVSGPLAVTVTSGVPVLASTVAVGVPKPAAAPVGPAGPWGPSGPCGPGVPPPSSMAWMRASMRAHMLSSAALRLMR